MALIDDQIRKYGVRNVDDLKWTETDPLFDKEREMVTTPHSSNVAAVRYDPYNGLLYVLFDNHREKHGPRLYMYFGGLEDLEDIYDDLFSAPSPGSVVWDRLRRPGTSFMKY